MAVGTVRNVMLQKVEHSPAVCLHHLGRDRNVLCDPGCRPGSVREIGDAGQTLYLLPGRHNGAFDLFGDPVLENRLLTGNFGQRDLAPFWYSSLKR